MSDYRDSIEQRIAGIVAPRFDFEAVRLKAEQRRQRPTRRRKVIAVILLTIAAPIVAVAAAHFVPLQVTHGYGNWQLYGPDKGETLLHPSPATFLRLAQKAPYQVVWPSGLPHGHKAFMLGGVGSEVFIIVYSCAGQRIDHASSLAVIIPKNYSAVNRKLGKWFSSQMQDHPHSAIWDVSEERVLFGSDCLTQRQIAHVQAAMSAKSTRPR